MLNCTDLACVLHHHHFYAHLHQLKHHLQDDNDNAFTDGGNVGGDNIQGILNETDSELSLQSPVDAPNDIIYIVCGVVIAMILVAVIIVLVAITINKLRKREETSSASPATIEAAQTTTYATTPSPQQNGHLNGSAKKHTNGLTTSASDSNVVLSNTGNGNLNNLNGSSDPSFNSSNQNSVWVFPPLPPQPNIYNCNNNIVSISFAFTILKLRFHWKKTLK
ncbi:hypothetical protein ACFFRR_007275 [Megaselia abdita]